MRKTTIIHLYARDKILKIHKTRGEKKKGEIHKSTINFGI